jgi:hypothetical protein
MTAPTNFDKLCPIFDYASSGGVLFPYLMIDMIPGAVNYLDFDGGVGSLATAPFIFIAPFAMRLVTCQAVAVKDDQGWKTAACSVEPIIKLNHNMTKGGSIGTGSLVATITCDLTGDMGTSWTPGSGTTEVELASGDNIVAYLATAASKGTGASGTQDGGAKVILWFASVNTPC